MKSEAEIREMIEVFKAEIEKNAKRPQFNRAEREAVAEIRERYLGKIAVLEWVLEPSEGGDAGMQADLKTRLLTGEQPEPKQLEAAQ